MSSESLLSEPRLVTEYSRSALDERIEQIFSEAFALSGFEVPHESQERWRDVVLIALPLAETLSQRYRGRGADADDLLQVARLGLVKAARGYRPGSPSGFTAYAVPTITGEIKRYFRDHEWLVRPPRALQELQQQVSECRRALWQTRGRMVTDSEVAHALGIDTQRVRAVALSGSAYRAAPEDLLDEHPTADSSFDQVLDRLAISDLFSSLGPSDSKLLWLRFVEGLSQSAIAEEIGVSQMQVSRLLARLLDRLRAFAAQEQQTAG